MDTATGLSPLTSYDLYISSDCGSNGTSSLVGPYTFLTMPSSVTTVTVGAGTSSSSTRGPFQRSDTSSSTVYSRFVQTYTASELATAGLSSGNILTGLNWELASSNTVIGSGNADLKVYIKNSSATSASAGSWTSLTSGSSLVVDRSYNTTNNFPGANGWMPFDFNSAFVYTGGALEIAVDWDCSQVSTPAFSGDGSLKWRWTSTSPDTLVVKKTSSSSASSTISDLKTDRANIQFTFTSTTCAPPAALNAVADSLGNAVLNWQGTTGASSYTWIIVPQGSGALATPIDSATTTNTMDNASGLMALVSYDLYVASNCGSNMSNFEGPFTFMAQPTGLVFSPIGTGSSSSSTRGPFQRSDTASSTVFSRFVQVYSANELASSGIYSGSVLTQLMWELASSNTLIGSGDATLKVYIKNSNASTASPDTWTNLTANSTMVVDRSFNSTNNFPGANGWMPFYFESPFTYTGGSIEVAVDWDCSQVSTPAFSGDGSLKWRWTSTAPDSMVVKKTSSSSASSNISDLKDERANIQFAFNPGATPMNCDSVLGLNAPMVGTTTATLEWLPSSNANAYTWWIVAAGAGSMGTPVDSATTTDTSASTSSLMSNTSYDLYLQADCSMASAGSSVVSGPYTFSTLDDASLKEIDIKSFSMHPNPSKGQVFIDLQLYDASNLSLRVLNSAGQVFQEKSISNTANWSTSLDLSNYEAGLYFIMIMVDDQASVHQLILR